MPVKHVRQTKQFEELYSRLDNSVKIKLDKLMEKVFYNPEMGKPMRFSRKGTREVYLKPFRFSYSFDEKNEVLTFLDLYHKDEQ